MVPSITVTLIVVGFLLAILGAFSRGYVRSRLRESGLTLRAWVTIGDELRNTETYLALARDHHFPKWPAILAVGSVPGAFLLMVLGVLLGR